MNIHVSLTFMGHSINGSYIFIEIIPTLDPIRSGISSLRGQGHYHFAKGTSIGKTLSLKETFEGAQRPRPGAMVAMSSACNSRPVQCPRGLHTNLLSKRKHSHFNFSHHFIWDFNLQENRLLCYKSLPFANRDAGCQGQAGQANWTQALVFLISRVWVPVLVLTLVSVSKTLNRYCFVLSMGHKTIGPMCYAMHVKEPITLDMKEVCPNVSGMVDYIKLAG